IKQLNILLLGENYARSSGLDLNLTRALVIAQTGILTGAITAFCGPIAFIGITVPHMARSLFHTSDHRILMPLCLFLGPMILLACDLLSKLPFSSTSIPINIVTSLMGAPLVVYILLKSRIMKASFG
ncbi:MAG: iron chelate uptake ABC transporter family permease subunit, partial [Bacteroidota bacterium]